MGESGGRMGGEWNGGVVIRPQLLSPSGGHRDGTTQFPGLPLLQGAPLLRLPLLGSSNDPCPPTLGCLPWLALRCLTSLHWSPSLP